MTHGRKEPFLPFAVPDIGEEEIAEVVSTLRSGWLTTGPKTLQFESEFSTYLGGSIEALAVNSCTAGLHLALEACGIGPGDEVITTPYTFTATAEVIRYLGANPVFADIDPATRNISAERIREKITSRTRAIIPVHFAGLPCDMEPILRIAHEHGLRVVEDAAHAFPARYRGTFVGALDSDVTVFSFYATKTITTGEGGMVCTRDPKLAARCRTMRLHGIDRAAFDRYTSTAPAWYYEVVAPGFKYNLTDVASALGVVQLRRAAAFQDRRARLAQRYTASFDGLPVRLPAAASENDLHAWHLYVLELSGEAPLRRDDFIREMAARGIGCSVHFIPLHLQPYWRDTYGLTQQQFPAATMAYRGAVSLPLHTRMSDEDQMRVIDAASELLRG